MNLNLDDIQIEIKLLENNRVFANAEIHFSEGFVLRGFRIQPSKQYSGLWVTPPSYPSSDKKWHDIFFMENKEEWKKLENKILDAYNQKLAEEHIDVGDIDI